MQSLSSVEVLMMQCEAALFRREMRAAVWFGEKSLSLLNRAQEPAKSAKKTKCALLFANVLFANEEYLRAHNVLEREQLLDRYTEANLLGARSLLGARDVDGALELLGESDESSAVWEKSSDARDENTVLLSSRTAMWRAHVFLALENRHQGAHWLVEALRRDPMNYEAFAALKEKHLLTSEQEEEVEHCVRKAPLDQTLIWEMYGCKLAVYAPKQIAVTAPLDVDLETARAENLYYSSRTAEALRVCKAVWDVQGASTLLTSVYVACLVEIPRQADELYHVAHELVQAKPHACISWYAVGCYYLLTGKFDMSRHYFRRCTSLDNSFGEGWIGFAHAFALQGEHDQAMAAYRSAARMMCNKHLPALCIAMEYLRVNNLALALKFAGNARQMCAQDPLVCNETGVAHYKSQQHAEALLCFQAVFSLLGENAHRRLEWEPSFYNAAHCHRKLKNYPEALRCFNICLSLKPGNPSVLSSIGLVHHLSNNLDKAIEFYHLALARSVAEDSFTNDMLKRALDDFQATAGK